MSSPLVHFAKWVVGLASAETQTTVAERACLTKYASGRKRLAEIGVWHGVSTRQLREVMAPDGTFFAIDPYPVGRLGFSTQKVIAQSGVAKVRRGDVIWLRTTGQAAANEPSVLEKPIDFLFIDGDHSYDGLRVDWESWSGLIASGGIIGLHDSRPTPSRPIHDAGSVRYTAEVIRLDSRFIVIDEVDSLTVLQRRESD
ncbi:MAG: class I SAM-dependent methyltransferase [Fimbriiglobus sp.]